MATVKKGILTSSPEWWKHLRGTKRQFWKAERRAAVAELFALADAEAGPDFWDTPSCGCVFCDIKLWPDEHGDHHVSQRVIRCAIWEAFP